MNDVLAQVGGSALAIGLGMFFAGFVLMCIGAVTTGWRRQLVGGLGTMLFVVGAVVGANGLLALGPKAVSALSVSGP